MGCTNSKATTTTPLITDDDFLIPDSFRSVVQTDRKRIDEHFLQEILQRHPDDQQTRENSSIIARKIIDLLLERNDIQTTKKLSKSLEDQLTSIPHQQIEQTIDLFKQIINKGSYHHSPTNNGKVMSLRSSSSSSPMSDFRSILDQQRFGENCGTNSSRRTWNSIERSLRKSANSFLQSNHLSMSSFDLD